MEWTREWFLETNSQVSASSCQLVFSKRKTNSFFVNRGIHSFKTVQLLMGVPGGIAKNRGGGVGGMVADCPAMSLVLVC